MERRIPPAILFMMHDLFKGFFDSNIKDCFVGTASEHDIKSSITMEREVVIT